MERITYDDLTGSQGQEPKVEASPRVTYEDLVQDEQKENTKQELEYTALDAIKNLPSVLGGGPLAASAIDKVSRIVSGTADLIGSAVSDAPKALFHSGYIMLHNAFADDDEDIDTAEESQAVMHAVNAISGFASPASAGLKDVTDRISEQAGEFIDHHEGKDFIDLAEEGDILEAADAFLGDVASGIPSVAAAFAGPGGLAAIGASAFGSKYQQEFEENPDQAAGNLF